MDDSPAVHPLPPPWPAILALRPMPPILSQERTLWLWGPTAVHGVALRIGLVHSFTHRFFPLREPYGRRRGNVPYGDLECKP
jgi:hypothetical protein